MERAGFRSAASTLALVALALLVSLTVIPSAAAEESLAERGGVGAHVYLDESATDVAITSVVSKEAYVAFDRRTTELDPYTYDDRPNYARPPPAEVRTYACGASTNSNDPAGSLGRVLRASAGLDADRVAPQATGRIPWNSYADYPKVTINGRTYADVGGRPYTQHAVDRLQPSGLGAPAGATGAGRSISPNYVEDVLSSSRGVPVKGPRGEPRLSCTSGTVQVITEDGIVVTVITR